MDERKISYLNQGISYLDTVSDDTVNSLLKSDVLFTSNENDIHQKDVYIIDVPTPIDENKKPNLSYIVSAMNIIEDKIKKGSLIVLESTTYPGTTEEYIVEILSKKGLIVGEDVYVAYSPERIDPGNEDSLETDIPRIIAGFSEKYLEKAIAFYGSNTYPVEHLKIAELAKIYENTFRLVNISLADEIHKISDALNIDVTQVIDAAATKPFGFMKFTPNLGIGGHCIPVDPYYITWLMEQKGEETPLISVAGEVNDSMLGFHLTKIKNHLKKNVKKEMSHIKCAILGLSYKKNVADTRMSSVTSLVEKMQKINQSVTIYDDVIYENKTIEQYPVEALGKNYSKLKKYDLVIYAVNHDVYKEDKKEIISNSALFYDLTWN